MSGSGQRTWRVAAGAAVAGALMVAIAVFVVVRPGDTGPAGAPDARTEAGREAAVTETQTTEEPAAPDPGAGGADAGGADAGRPGTGDVTPDPLAATPESTAADDEALAALEQTYQDDQGTVAFNGQFAAQLASKYPGISDPLQVNDAGSHTFGAADILAEHQQLRTVNGDAEHPVILVKSTDYGKRRTDNGNFYWVTFAVGDFPDRQSVRDWCATQFATLTEAERANQCVVARLRPPA